LVLANFKNSSGDLLNVWLRSVEFLAIHKRHALVRRLGIDGFPQLELVIGAVGFAFQVIFTIVLILLDFEFDLVESVHDRVIILKVFKLLSVVAYPDALQTFEISFLVERSQHAFRHTPRCCLGLSCGSSEITAP
jgi:hypothetical protein